MTLQFGASLTYDTSSINYDRNMFIIQATGPFKAEKLDLTNGTHMKMIINFFTFFRQSKIEKGFHGGKNLLLCSDVQK